VKRRTLAKADARGRHGLTPWIVGVPRYVDVDRLFLTHHVISMHDPLYPNKT
jgi:hypothetical protein